ncbi:MAG TPA: hypothetical protein VIJ03_06875 [Candidatus Dormibacteraeota bacterium]
MELPPPSSSRCRIEPNTAANGQPHAIAEPIATISRGWNRRSGDGSTSGDGLSASDTTAVGSSDCEHNGYPPDRAADDQPVADTDSLDPPHADADR